MSLLHSGVCGGKSVIAHAYHKIHFNSVQHHDDYQSSMIAIAIAEYARKLTEQLFRMLFIAHYTLHLHRDSERSVRNKKQALASASVMVLVRAKERLNFYLYLHCVGTDSKR